MKLSKIFCKLKEELLSCYSTVCFVWLSRGDQPTSSHNLSVLFFLWFNTLFLPALQWWTVHYVFSASSELNIMFQGSSSYCDSDKHNMRCGEKKFPHDRNANRETLFSKCFLLAHMELQSEILTCNLLHGCLMISCGHESKLPLYVDNEIADHRAATSALVWRFSDTRQKPINLVGKVTFSSLGNLVSCFKIHKPCVHTFICPENRLIEMNLFYRSFIFWVRQTWVQVRTE